MLRFAFIACLVPGVWGESRIINGMPAVSCPYIVSIRMGCGGSILDANTILTAAHCFIPGEYDLARETIRAGSLSASSGGQVRNIAEVHVHPKYNPEVAGSTHDLAILRLSKPLVFDSQVAPIPLSSTPPAVGAQVRVAGWGGTVPYTPDTNVQDVRQIYPEELREGIVTVISQDQALQWWPKHEPRPDQSTLDLLVLTGQAGSLGAVVTDSCQGDSGGPLALASAASPVGYVQVGVVSYGFGCGQSNAVSAYGRVAADLAWIRQYSTATITTPVPAPAPAPCTGASCGGSATANAIRWKGAVPSSLLEYNSLETLEVTFTPGSAIPLFSSILLKSNVKDLIVGDVQVVINNPRGPKATASVATDKQGINVMTIKVDSKLSADTRVTFTIVKGLGMNPAAGTAVTFSIQVPALGDTFVTGLEGYTVFQPGALDQVTKLTPEQRRVLVDSISRSVVQDRNDFRLSFLPNPSGKQLSVNTPGNPVQVTVDSWGTADVALGVVLCYKRGFNYAGRGMKFDKQLGDPMFGCLVDRIANDGSLLNDKPLTWRVTAVNAVGSAMLFRTGTDGLDVVTDGGKIEATAGDTLTTTLVTVKRTSATIGFASTGGSDAALYGLLALLVIPALLLLLLGLWCCARSKDKDLQPTLEPMPMGLPKVEPDSSCGLDSNQLPWLPAHARTPDVSPNLDMPSSDTCPIFKIMPQPEEAI